MVRLIRLGFIGLPGGAGFYPGPDGTGNISTQADRGYGGTRFRAGPRPGPLTATLIFLLFLMISATLPAQTFQVSAAGNIGLGYQLKDKNVYEPGFNGGGIRFDQTQYITDTNLSFLNGFEFSFQGWGSQLLVSNGMAFRLFPQITWDEQTLKAQPGKLSLDVRLLAMNGMLLLKPKLLYTGALQVEPVLSYQINKKIALHLAAGYRYAFSPGYRDYGSIWSYSDVPISLGISWRYD